MFSMKDLRAYNKLVLGTLLFFFILSMSIGGLVGGANIINVIFGGLNTNLYVGKVGEQYISHQAYQNERQRILDNYRNSQQELSSLQINSAYEQAWNRMVERLLIRNQVEKLKLTASWDELVAYMSETPPPYMQNTLMGAGHYIYQEDFVDNPDDLNGQWDEGEEYTDGNGNEKYDSIEDGIFDLSMFKESLLYGGFPSDIDELFHENGFYNNVAGFLGERKLRDLYSQTASVSDADVNYELMRQNTTMTIDELSIEYLNIPDSLINISDKNIESYYKEYKDEKFKQFRTRQVQYVLWKKPTLTEKDTTDTFVLEQEMMEEALNFVAEAFATSFQDAANTIENVKLDTMNIYQEYEQNSGVPTSLGNSRNVVRYIFDNPLATISDPIQTDNGLIVVKSFNEKKAGYKPLNEVKRDIEKFVIQDKKKDYAISMLENAIQNSQNWEEIAQNDLIKLEKDVSKNMKYTYGTMAGIIQVLNIGDISHVFDESAGFRKKITAIQLIDKTTTDYNEEDFNKKRQELLAAKTNNNSPNNPFRIWLDLQKEKVKILDYRSQLY